MKLISIYWRDIPSQIIINKGRARTKHQLSHRFQAAIDRAAMRAGKGSSDLYLEDWRRTTTPLEATTDVESLISEIAINLENQFTDQDLDLLIKNHGNSAAGETNTGEIT
jgi:hypothetical protein